MRSSRYGELGGDVLAQVYGFWLVCPIMLHASHALLPAYAVAAASETR